VHDESLKDFASSHSLVLSCVLKGRAFPGVVEVGTILPSFIHREKDGSQIQFFIDRGSSNLLTILTGTQTRRPQKIILISFTN
jgi:hypothetical protein